MIITKKIAYYTQRAWSLGFTGITSTLVRRTTRYYFAYVWRKKAHAHQANHRWAFITKKYKLNAFSDYFERLKQNNFCEQVLCKKLFQDLLPNTYRQPESLFFQADQVAQNCFEIFGKKICFQEKIDWHSDVTTSTPSPTSWQNSFYQAIESKPGVDIKVPWELARMHHLFLLGKAYTLAEEHGDRAKNLGYAQVFESHVTSFITNNPYLLGVNWKCPMDVAIRAINLIWGFHFFKHDESISLIFWEQLVCSLYDHLHYLENNWETSDKPNNHYIADLVGALYLTCFLSNSKSSSTKVDIKKVYATPLDFLAPFKKKIIKNLIEQFEHQIQLDGTSYEGSTNYHKLVTELFLHTKLVCESNSLELPRFFYEKFDRMLTFLQDCTDAISHNLVQIGDNDSGIVVTGIDLTRYRQEPAICPGIKNRVEKSCEKTAHEKIEQDKQQKNLVYVTTHPNFGLSIITYKTWHMTFRHPTFLPAQPSGHFHQDQLAITLSINGSMIFIDPGTYVYTANPTLRNQLRSIEHHTTFYLNTYEHAQKNLHTQDLFQLARTAHKTPPELTRNNHEIILQDSHHEYLHADMIAHRKLTFNPRQEVLSLCDWFEYTQHNNNVAGSDPEKKDCTWVFVCAPDIFLEQQENLWLLKKEKKVIATLESSLHFEDKKGLFSPSYGVITSTRKLVATARAPLSPEKNIIKISVYS